MTGPGTLELPPEEIARRADQARRLLSPCTLCPRGCRVDRNGGAVGQCGETAAIRVGSAGPHFGEEPPLVGTGGSGTIFLSGCNLGCHTCQNAGLSSGDEGDEVTPEELSRLILRLQEIGCHNMNFVTPTHQVPGILDAVALAVRNGLRVPLVFNCGGYESLEVLELLDGVFDIFMPDFKFLDGQASRRYLEAPDYPEVALAAIRWMQSSVGVFVFDGRGLARRGLLIRHLVMPGLLADTEAILETIAGEISGNAYVNVMGQYRPCHRAVEHPEIDRRPTAAEMAQAHAAARAVGLSPGQPGMSERSAAGEES